jgi:hypothetical protein
MTVHQKFKFLSVTVAYALYDGVVFVCHSTYI